MRPIKLEVQGLTSFREKAEIDFSDLDLFAITGHTGAGKSSLVDAITYALFGEVPRVGDSIKQLISQGEDRVRVNLEFSADGGRYRVHRSTGHKGVPAVQMEHLDAATAEWLPDADKVRDVNEHIASILGMDYDGFVRSILLPQGQFQQFLAGKPEERRKVLDGLLRLDVYQQMQQRANQIADEHSRTVATLQQQLETQYADATPEALKEAKASLAALRTRAEAISTLRGALTVASRAAEAMSAAAKRRDDAMSALRKAETEKERAGATLEAGEKQQRALDDRLKAVEANIEANQFDADVMVALQQAKTALENLDRTEKRRAETRRTIEEAAPRLDHLRAAAEEARESARQVQLAVEEARRIVEEAKRDNTAAALRRGLSPGDACPVCGQPVGSLPETRHVALDQAEGALASATKTEASTREKLEGLSREMAALDQRVSSERTRLAELDSDCESEREKAVALLAGKSASAAEVKALIDVQEAARRDRTRLNDELRQVTREREEHLRASQSAGRDVARLESEMASLSREADSASREADDARAGLAAAAATHDWTDVAAALASDRDVAPLLKQKLTAADEDSAGIHREIGACESAIERITEGIQRAKDLRGQIDDAGRSGRLAADLAALLRVTKFPNYIRERALRLLAQDGSRQLSDVSGGRYEFAVEGQEFLVVDSWNANETRSVKTLSGGETFLASLALALALAEHLPGFGAGAHTHALESLFIDEGFSNLDTETLDIVASALEVIGQGGSRLVGVVTHLPALAERMPARITVHKSQTGSTVTVD